MDRVESLAREFASRRGHRDVEAMIVTTDTGSLPVWQFYTDQARSALATVSGPTARHTAPTEPEPPRRDEDPWCDEIGRCEGQVSSREAGICSCTHCGKELHFRDGHWWTWDAKFYPHPQPQNETD